MGQKVFKNNSIMAIEGFYQNGTTHTDCFPGSSLREPVGMSQNAFNTFRACHSQCRLINDTILQCAYCEFEDYCNHLYYIDDRCDCASTWKKTTGLVIPTSS